MPAGTVRFRWLSLSSWTTFVGMSFLLCSLVGIVLTLQANSYTSPVLRLQHDRGQIVVDSGVYRYVRHPLYSSAIFFYVAAPLVFNSGVGLLLSPIFVGTLLLHSVREEQILQEGLPGYDAYLKRVTSRFFPHIW
jgi:protein-S-isoprenylcysteine O-methyltransferase Ste14